MLFSFLIFSILIVIDEIMFHITCTGFGPQHCWFWCKKYTLLHSEGIFKKMCHCEDVSSFTSTGMRLVPRRATKQQKYPAFQSVCMSAHPGLDVWICALVLVCVCVFPAVWQGWQVCRQRFDRRLMRKLSQALHKFHTHTHCEHTASGGEKRGTFCLAAKISQPNYNELTIYLITPRLLSDLLGLAIKTRTKMNQHQASNVM